MDDKYRWQMNLEIQGHPHSSLDIILCYFTVQLFYGRIYKFRRVILDFGLYIFIAHQPWVISSKTKSQGKFYQLAINGLNDKQFGKQF